MYNELLDLGKGLRGGVRSILLTFVVGVILLPFALVYAASSPYTFTMQYAVTNGCSNGTFHTLDAGSAKLSGSAYAGTSNLPISYNLQREVFGPNPSYGSVNGGINTSFSNLSFSSVPASSNFCLVVSRNGYDAWTVQGSGTLHN